MPHIPGWIQDLMERLVSILKYRPHLDRFATSLNHKLNTFVSLVPDPLAYAVDAMSISWKGMFAYAFPPFKFLPFCRIPCRRVTKRADVGSLNLDALLFLSAERVDSL
jgi:hypothetical protein